MVGRYIFPLRSDEELLVFEKKINYNFANRALLREALQGSNALNGDGNKTLALIGVVKNPCQSQIGRNVMIDTMQAIVGAVYLDCNEQIPPCADVMTALGLSWPE
ncbi:hypothetical protein PEX2_053260 [Penicillium expansum]|uniref:RNase III domain-containing protein n=1 Tax=Penicillium expansum TaxID=27334 RepID=A0A0A2JYN8_PENEN|nr:hypothetical protein PEX2_053260 [Penicillium expansum]KGO59748.1 hypothetical protein PEX2_053260 [Penicillium expansum]